MWAFLGDGEMDEPESLGAIGVAAREGLDNLTFVVNCNLQRLDGPVRGNGKIIQELESHFRGAGWNVIKVVWGRDWDPLLAQDLDGVLVNKMNTTPDGQFQTYATETGAYIREHFFGDDPRLRKMVEHLTDDQLRTWAAAATTTARSTRRSRRRPSTPGQPTVILAQTIKGWTLGQNFEGRNATHQMKKLTKDELKEFRDRLHLPIPDKELEDGLPPYYHPGRTPRRSSTCTSAGPPSAATLPAPGHPRQAAEAAGRQRSTRPQEGLGQAGDRHDHGVRPAAQGPHAGQGDRQAVRADRPGRVPHLRHGLVLPDGQDLQPARPARTSPVDRELLLSYKESPTGQMLHEGITEAGSMASLIAAGSAYATHGEPLIPVYVFYSMFGFQRTGDQFWQMADQLAAASCSAPPRAAPR